MEQFIIMVMHLVTTPIHECVARGITTERSDGIFLWFSFKRQCKFVICRVKTPALATGVQRHSGAYIGSQHHVTCHATVTWLCALCLFALCLSF